MQSAEKEHQKKKGSKETIGQYIQTKPQSKSREQKANIALILGQKYAQ